MIAVGDLEIMAVMVAKTLGKIGRGAKCVIIVSIRRQAANSDTLVSHIFSFYYFLRSYQWIMKHNGIPTEDSYGNYLGIDGFCHIDDPNTVMALEVRLQPYYV